MPPREDYSQRSYGTDAAVFVEDGGGAARNNELRCDYLVVGAGASGMAFVDTIIAENPSATVVLVDRNDKPGGHWVHAYPFCRLHAASAMYGVNSLPLGKNLNSKGWDRYDTQDRATCQEVVEYYEKVCDQFKASGRVKAFFGVEYKSFDAERGVHSIVPKNSENSENDAFNVKCGKLVTVATNVVVPSMRKAPIPVHKDANFVSVNEVSSSVESGKFRKYVVFGGGKTGADTIVYLLQQGIDQSQITWIVSRDVWYFLRDAMEDFFEYYSTLMKPLLKSRSVEEAFLAWEKKGLLGRLDPNGPFPQVFKGPIMDKKELDLMRSIEHVVRMGRAISINESKVMLDRGSLDFTKEDTLLVDCMVDGMYGFSEQNFGKDFEVFEPGRINLGPLTFFLNIGASAAHIAFLECALNNDESKNECCYFQRGKHVHNRPELFIGMLYLQNKGNEKLMKVPGGGKYMMTSRTNMAAPLHHKGGLLRFLWFFFGPERGVKTSNKFTKKMEAKGFRDIDHLFGAEKSKEAANV